MLEEQLSSNQYCSVSGKSVLEAVSVLRNVVALAELRRTPLCLLSLHFRSAFGYISHCYLFHILVRYGIRAWIIYRILSMYGNATASPQQINGALADPIPFQSVIRQECPLSMALYALCVHPLLPTLEGPLTGVSIGTRGKRISVLAYDDDITVFPSNLEDIEKVHHAIRIYERATGTQLNPNKSRALAVGVCRSRL